MFYFCVGLVKLWLCCLSCLCLTQESEQSSLDALPAPLFSERTEDQVERFLANAPPGEDDGVRPGLKVFVSEHFSVSLQLAFVVGGCACLVLMLPGAFLIVSGIQGSELSSQRVTQLAITLAVLSIAWVMLVYTLAFSRNSHSYDVQEREIQVMDRETAPGNLFIGDLNHWRMQGLLSEWGGGLVRHPQRRAGDGMPHSLFMLFQMMLFLQAITPLLALSHAKIRTWGAIPMWLMWSVVVYAPLCYWIRGGGWLADCVDVGGTVPMHIAVGFTALGLSFFVDRAVCAQSMQRGSFYAGAIMYLGGTMLLAGCRSVSHAPWPTFDLLNQFMGGVAGVLIWSLVAQRSRNVKVEDWPLGLIAGMVTLASGCASMPPTSAIIAGALGTFVCCVVLSMGASRPAVHWLLFVVFGLSGVVGLVLTGVLASPEIAGADIAGKPIVGLIAGGTEMLRVQALAAAVAGTLAFAGGLLLPRVAVPVGAVLEWMCQREPQGVQLNRTEASNV